MKTITMGEVQEFDIVHWKGVDYVVNNIVSPTSAIGLSLHRVKDRKPNVLVGHKSHEITLIRRNHDYDQHNL